MRFLIAALFCFTALTFGCSSSVEEAPTATAMVPDDSGSAAATEVSVDNAVQQTSLASSVPDSASGSAPSIDDITARDESNRSAASGGAAGGSTSDSVAPDNADKGPQTPAQDEVPQEVKDLPTQKVRQNFPDGQQHRLFEAKILPGKRVLYHGGYIEYYSNGNRQKAGRYDYAKKTGPWQFWSKAGVLRKQGAYQQDRQQGEWKKWREDGTLEWIERYRDGLADGKWIAFGDDGKTVMWERSYQAGKRHGAWLNYYPTGEKHSVETYANGKLHGPAMSWHQNGQVEMEGAYANGQRHGMFKKFGPGGDQVNQAEWTNGKL